MDYIIGVDSGGTKTKAVSFDLDGNLLNTAQSGAGNLTVAFDTSIENTKEAVLSLQKLHSGDNCIYAAFGYAGAETGSLKNAALSELSAFFGTTIKELFITNDALLALYSALEGQDGALIISGTGSIGYLKHKNDAFRFGGWGHLISDEGSGYYIGITAIKYITGAYDNGNENTPLKSAVFQKLAITSHRELIAFTYGASKAEIASLCTVVEGLAQEKDPQAVAILTKAGEKLAYLAINLLRLHPIPSPNIALSGSVLRKIPMVKKSFLQALSQNALLKHEKYTIIDRDFEPSKACYYLYNTK